MPLRRNVTRALSVLLICVVAAIAIPQSHRYTVAYAAEPQCNTDLAKDQTAIVPAGCTALGDVKVGPALDGPWSFFTDDVDTSGFLVRFDLQGAVQAPFGAGLSDVNPALLVKAMLAANGCGLTNGCDLVTLIGWSYYTKQSPPPPPSGSFMPNPACQFDIHKDQIVRIPAGCTVSGDVDISASQDGPWSYFSDNADDTGYSIHFDRAGYVKATYADASSSDSPQGELVAGMLNSGCTATGCNSVTAIRWSVFTKTDGPPEVFLPLVTLVAPT
ncbi:MAG: hypothetical protein RI947_1519 [Candidatus Parcubacteria bacterium]